MEPRTTISRRRETPWWRRARRPAVLLAAAAVTLVAGAGGAVAATVGGSSNVLHGCYAKSDGDLRLVKTGQRCQSSEIAVSWNKVGPAGPKGDIGSAGPVGPAGPFGLSGYVQEENQFSVRSLDDVIQYVQCPTNQVLTGGGLTLLSPLGGTGEKVQGPEIQSNGPVNLTTWEVMVGNTENVPITLGEWITCATAG